MFFIEIKGKTDWYFLDFRAGSGSRSFIPRNGSDDPDPYQNETDPKHCLYIKKICDCKKN